MPRIEQVAEDAESLHRALKPPPLPAAFDARITALEHAVHAVLARLDAESRARTRVQRVAYVFGGLIAGAVGETLRGALDAHGPLGEALRALLGG